jgi:hypothetical protein
VGSFPLKRPPTLSLRNSGRSEFGLKHEINTGLIRDFAALRCLKSRDCNEAIKTAATDVVDACELHRINWMVQHG